MGIDSPVKRLTRGVERKTSNSVEGRGFTLGVLETLIHEAEVGCVVEGLVPILLPETQRGKGEPDQNPKRAKAPGSRRNSGEARRSSLQVGDAEAEFVGDGLGDVVGQVVELLLDGRQRRGQRRRGGNRGQRALLAACDAGEEEEEEAEKLNQHGEAQGHAPAPPLELEGLGIAHSEAGEEQRQQQTRKINACEEMRKRRLVSPIYI